MTANRMRILEALAAEVEESGYAATTVADIVRRARVSRRTFYESFPDRDSCYLALADHINTTMVDAVGATFDSAVGVPLSERVGRALQTFVTVARAAPGITLSLHRELPALGAAGMRKRREMLTRFAALVTSHVDRESATPTAAMFLVSGFNEVIASAIEDGTDPAAALPALRRLVLASLDADVDD
ncbi:MAG: TetR/AcrR family transcriptional regulator [Gordonia sp. (in: high G+C Gram-positive bacteria)]|jgi:AcrR family transcriptional regulator|nr:TetR/AcrR family transcriptional regulator [Gordonia sp. (in: high G+C Gram-positive bacteria)]